MTASSTFVWLAPAIGLAGLWLGWVLGGRGLGRADASPSRPKAGPEEPATPLPAEEGDGLDRQYLFMGKVAHALRNPLTGVLMSAELLQEEDDPTQIRLALERILEQGRQMREIIMRIQEATALEACQYRLDLEAVQLREAVQEIMDLHQSRARAKGQQLEVEPFSDQVRVVADRRFLFNILGELLSNAIKFSPKQSRIRVGGQPSAHGFQVWVEDEGPGLSLEEQTQLFQRFVKLSPSPTAGESHIGLGLWSARLMAETLGGDLRCEPGDPKGARFTLDLLQAYVRPSTSTIMA